MKSIEVVGAAIMKGGRDLVLEEHVDSRWIERGQLYDFDWAPADIKILPEIEKACFG